jgi:DNA mismatch endonuclease, patch repair protein
MADVFTAPTRSRIMSKIRANGNRSTELRLVRLFRDNGIKGWRRCLPLPGRPDFVFREKRIVIFVDGCFWHGCPRCRNTPATNAAYWAEKNKRNRKRDRLVTRLLTDGGWRVIRIWEHRLRRPNTVIHSLTKLLTNDSTRQHNMEGKSAVAPASALYACRDRQAGVSSKAVMRGQP